MTQLSTIRFCQDFHFRVYIDGSMQERHNSTALTMELRLSCTNPSMWDWHLMGCYNTMAETCHDNKGQIETPPNGHRRTDLTLYVLKCVNTLRARWNCRHFTDNIFKCILLNENIWILLKILLKFVPKVLMNTIPALVLIMAWCWPGDKLLSEPMMVSLLQHIHVNWPQWVKGP